MNTLIVDDKEENLYLLEALLRGNGHNVESAKNGAEAFEKLKSGKFELIISDILMPVMDGFQLCRKVKMDKTLRQIPFIIYTATYTGPKDEEFAKKIGADRFIQKPCEPDVLMESVRDVMATTKDSDVDLMPRPIDDDEILKLYSERLVRKLEQKMLELEQEVRARREVEESLRQSEERYRAIFEGAAEGILIVEHLTRDIKYVNPAMCQMLGYDEDELKHLNVNDIHPVSILDRLGSEFEVYDRESKIMFRQNLECLKKDGTVIYTDIVTTPRIVINGIPHSVSFFMDVTQRRKAEDEKKKIEIQLSQSQKLEAVGQLTGGIAHDFNNILTAIIGNAEIILSILPKGDQIREGIEEIRDAGERASGLISQLLAFSRKQVLQPTIMSLNESVREMDRLFRRIIGEDIELRTILAPDLGLVEMDQGQMEQVIMNLMVNARDAMPTGGKITIETVNVELDEEYARSHIAVIPGPYVMMSVSDTGVGMTKEVQEHIFEPFYTTKEKGKGTGLGLSTVYGIVKQSKGNIWVYTELGKGTTFKVYLPRVDGPISKKKKDKKTEGLTGSETILVVEDDENVRKFAERVLKGFGYRVLIAANGEEAVRVAKEHEGAIDLMLTDVVMPGMSGQDLEDKLRASKLRIKVIYMSGYTDDAIVHNGILEKGKIFLQKPFTIEALGRKVREALGD
jgi:two-component system cell cycle sensor histidine kinase/response regulator CckA